MSASRAPKSGSRGSTKRSSASGEGGRVAPSRATRRCCPNLYQFCNKRKSIAERPIWRAKCPFCATKTRAWSLYQRAMRSARAHPVLKSGRASSPCSVVQGDLFLMMRARAGQGIGIAAKWQAALSWPVVQPSTFPLLSFGNVASVSTAIAAFSAGDTRPAKLCLEPAQVEARDASMTSRMALKPMRGNQNSDHRMSTGAASALAVGYRGNREAGAW